MRNLAENSALTLRRFENKGSMMGCSNPHPHGQAWSLSYIPAEAQKLLRSQKEYFVKHSRVLLLDYVQAELKSKSPRIVVATEHFVALVPYWALWPYEVMICPAKRQIRNITELEPDEKEDLAQVLRRMTCRYDNREEQVMYYRMPASLRDETDIALSSPVFQCSFPYSMGIYQQPTLNYTEYKDSVQLHFSFNPPLLRSASVRKFLVGFEMFGEPQRDLTAEQAAAKLKDCSETHYKTRE